MVGHAGFARDGHRDQVIGLRIQLVEHGRPSGDQGPDAVDDSLAHFTRIQGLGDELTDLGKPDGGAAASLGLLVEASTIRHVLEDQQRSGDLAPLDDGGADVL